MNIFWNTRNKFFLGGIVALIVAMILFVWYEFQYSRDQLLLAKESEAKSLIQTLNRSSENTFLSNEEVENVVLDRIGVTAAMIAGLETRDAMTDQSLARLEAELGVNHIAIIGADGVVLHSSDSTRTDTASTQLLQDMIAPILRGEAKQLPLRMQLLPYSAEPLFSIARARERNAGAIIVGISARRLLEFRRRIGIGKLIQDIASDPEITYIVMQDDEGIITASRGVTSMNAIESDSFLVQAYHSKDPAATPRTRIFTHEGKKVFEVVKRMNTSGAGTMLTRMGLSMEKVRDIQQRTMQRVIILAIGAVIAGAIFLGFMLTRERLAVLREKHERFQTYTGLVLDNVADAVLAVDADRRVTVWNNSAETLFERSESEVVGRAYEEIFPRDQMYLSHTIEQRSPILYLEIEYRRADGSLMILGVSTSIIEKSNKEIDTVIAIARDLTEQKKIQEKLRRQEKLTATGILASGIAHEIRNPLNAINIIVQRFQHEFEPKEGPEEYHALATTVRSEVQRVNQIIKQFLEFAKPPKLDKRITDLSSVLHDSIRIVSSQAKMSSIVIEPSIGKNIQATVDAERMKQVLLNLYQNALEAMPGGGVLRITLDRNERNVFIRIADTGTGIAAENFNKIFNLYFTTKPHGTGFGLSLVHQIIQEHDGTITFTSATGVGTTFTIELPLA